MQTIFTEFAQWYGKSSGHQKAALSLSRYILFFQELESRWQRIPPYNEILEAFGADTLRRHKKAIQWLTESGQIIPDPKFKEVITEKHRIRRMLEQLPPSSKASLILSEYTAELLKRCDNGNIQLRTVRLSLTPAIGLLQISSSQPDESPVQDSVDRYLSEHPGQRAALTGFLTFLNNRHQICLKLPSTARTSTIRRARVESRLASLAKCEWNQHITAEWIMLALEYFHGVSGVSRAQALKIDRAQEQLGMQLEHKGQSYFIPAPISSQHHKS